MHYLVKPLYLPFLFAIDLLGSICFFWTKLCRTPNSIKKILVIRLDHAGDMLMTTPVFRALKKEFPNAELCVLCRPFVKSLIENNKNVSQIFTLEVPWFKRNDSVSWCQTIKFLLNLRKQRFDFVFELHADPRNIFAVFLVGGYRVGYSVRGFGFLLNKIANYSAQKKHVIGRNLDVVRSIGADADSSLDFFLTVQDKNNICKLLATHKVEKYILIHPFAGRPEKLWSLDSWAKLCSDLIKKYRTKIIFSGSSGDYEACESIKNLISERYKSFVLNFCGLLGDFKALGALIDKSKIVVSTDTVSVHLAHALNKKLVSLFGATDPAVWGYSSKKEISLYIKLADSCSADCRNEAHRMKMIGQISVNDVLSAVEKLL